MGLLFSSCNDDLPDLVIYNIAVYPDDTSIDLASEVKSDYGFRVGTGLLILMLKKVSFISIVRRCFVEKVFLKFSQNS